MDRAVARPTHRKHRGPHGAWWLSLPSGPFTRDVSPKFSRREHNENMHRRVSSRVQEMPRSNWSWSTPGSVAGTRNTRFLRLVHGEAGVGTEASGAEFASCEITGR